MTHIWLFEAVETYDDLKGKPKIPECIAEYCIKVEGTANYWVVPKGVDSLGVDKEKRRHGPALRTVAYYFDPLLIPDLESAERILHQEDMRGFVGGISRAKKQDNDLGHAIADAVVARMLDLLGHRAAADAYRAIPKKFADEERYY